MKFLNCSACGHATPHLEQRSRPNHFRCFDCATERHYGSNIISCPWCSNSERERLRGELEAVNHERKTYARRVYR